MSDNASKVDAVMGDMNLGPASMNLLGGVQIRTAIGRAMGVDVPNTSDVTLVGLVIDDSGSIRFSNLTDSVRQGHNLVIDSLRGASSKHSIQAHCSMLNTGQLYPFVPLTGAMMLDTHNYNPQGNTPLNNRVIEACGAIAAKQAEMAASGINSRAVLIVCTDGFDTEERRGGHSAADVNTIVTDLIKTETVIILGIGVGDEADFKAVFQSWGLPKEWIKTVGADPKELRAVFQTASSVAVSASQNAGSFSKAAGGGFNI